MNTEAKTAAPRGDSATARMLHRAGFADEREFILRVVQPALVGLIDGTVSSLAPIFAAAIASSSHTALLVGFSTALGAGVSMGWSEALSDTGEQTGQGSAIVRGWTFRSRASTSRDQQISSSTATARVRSEIRKPR